VEHEITGENEQVTACPVVRSTQQLYRATGGYDGQALDGLDDRHAEFF